MKTSYPALNNFSRWAFGKGKRCAGCAKTTCSGSTAVKKAANKVMSDLHPSKSSFGRLFRNDPICLQWYPCPATARLHRITQWGQLGETLGGVRFPECAAKRSSAAAHTRGLAKNTGTRQSKISNAYRDSYAASTGVPIKNILSARKEMSTSCNYLK